eukprot:scaffold79084_cov57-Phaeocystis_antarctica.AAC.1
MFVLDVLCSAGLVLFALANAKVLAALAAVAAVARARRAAKAEACRILDTSVTPSAAFRACFDEPAPTVAERVKMTALA